MSKCDTLTGVAFVKIYNLLIAVLALLEVTKRRNYCFSTGFARKTFAGSPIFFIAGKICKSYSPKKSYKHIYSFIKRFNEVFSFIKSVVGGEGGAEEAGEAEAVHEWFSTHLA